MRHADGGFVLDVDVRHISSQSGDRESPLEDCPPSGPGLIVAALACKNDNGKDYLASS